MQIYPMSFMDYAFFLTETDENPKHVGLIALFRKPEDAPDNYLRDMVDEWLACNKVEPPFNLKLYKPLIGMPSWRVDSSFNASRHCFYHRISEGGGRSEFYQKVCELHERPLDRYQPAWALHFFDDVKGGRFGVYFVMHHAYGDGQTIAQWIFTMLSANAEGKNEYPLWSNAFDFGNQHGDNKFIDKWKDKLKGNAKKSIGSLYGLGRISSQLCIEALGLTKNAISIPFTAKPSCLTGQVPRGRDFATAAVPMKNVNRLRKITRSTLNHVAITCLDMAMNRYLDEIAAPLDGPFTILMPVSLRAQDAKKGGGNDIGMVPVKLSTKTDDPIIRLRQVGEALQGVRHQVNASPSSSIAAYTLLTISLPQVAEMMSMSETLPPLGHAIVSNVPGPPSSVYLDGSLLEETYPISTLTPGMLLNITIFSYDGTLFFGLLAGKDTLPDLNCLGSYIYEAFMELEEYATSPDKGLEKIALLREASKK